MTKATVNGASPLPHTHSLLKSGMTTPMMDSKQLVGEEDEGVEDEEAALTEAGEGHGEAEATAEATTRMDEEVAATTRIMKAAATTIRMAISPEETVTRTEEKDTKTEEKDTKTEEKDTRIEEKDTNLEGKATNPEVMATGKGEEDPVEVPKDPVQTVERPEVGEAEADPGATTEAAASESHLPPINLPSVTTTAKYSSQTELICWTGFFHRDKKTM